MKRTLIILAGMITILVIAYLAYDLTKGVISPCETIFEQSSVQIGAKLKLIESQGEVLIGKEKIQDLTETAQVTALNLKTCCIVLNAGNVDAKQFLTCKESAKQYETKVDTVIEQLKEAEVARKTGDRKLVEDQVRKINETLEEARRVSEEFQREIDAISAVSKEKGTQEEENRVSEDFQRDIEAIPAVPKVKGTKRKSSEIIFQWDGASQTYWSIYQKDAYDDYKKVADTSWLKKGQQATVELAPGEYRVKMNWEHGFGSKDVAVKVGESVLIHPVFGAVTFQWDGASQTYWSIYQKDAYDDYKKVADTSWLKKGQQATVELAPGEYRVKMNWEHGFGSKDVAVKVGESVLIHPVFGAVTFQWDGASQTYWSIYQKDAYDDYKKVADTSWLKKGQQATVELAPGEYRVKMNWEHGFGSKDVAVKVGESVLIHPVFGAVTFQWDGASQTYWSIYQKDAYDDYKKVADTSWLKKGQQATVELAPGEYRVQREVEGALKTNVVVSADEVIYVVK